MTDNDFELIGDWDDLDVAVTGILMPDAQGRVLMQLRDIKTGLAASGEWSMFGGHIDPGEDVQTCAIREAHEETGIVIEPDDLVPFVRFVKPVYGPARHYVVAKKTPIKPSDVRLGEGAGFGFLTREQLSFSNMNANAHMVLTRYFDQMKLE